MRRSLSQLGLVPAAHQEGPIRPVSGLAAAAVRPATCPSVVPLSTQCLGQRVPMYVWGIITVF